MCFCWSRHMDIFKSRLWTGIFPICYIVSAGTFFSSFIYSLDSALDVVCTGCFYVTHWVCCFHHLTTQTNCKMSIILRLNSKSKYIRVCIQQLHNPFACVRKHRILQKLFMSFKVNPKFTLWFIVFLEGEHVFTLNTQNGVSFVDSNVCGQLSDFVAKF